LRRAAAAAAGLRAAATAAAAQVTFVSRAANLVGRAPRTRQRGAATLGFAADHAAARGLRLAVDMTARRVGIRETAVSAIVFGAVLFALISFDPRVKAQLTDSVRMTSAATLGHRASEVGGTLWRAARDKSMDGAPVLIFATVGTVLTVFMLRT
jgi:hypothetical protein